MHEDSSQRAVAQGPQIASLPATLSETANDLQGTGHGAHSPLAGQHRPSDARAAQDVQATQGAILHLPAPVSLHYRTEQSLVGMSRIRRPVRKAPAHECDKSTEIPVVCSALDRAGHLPAWR